MSYGWIIYYNKHEHSPIFGSSRIGEEVKAALAAGEGEEFELYDGDDKLYCKGRIMGDYNGFEPLDDYGISALGCVDIKYNGRSL